MAMKTKSWNSQKFKEKPFLEPRLFNFNVNLWSFKPVKKHATFVEELLGKHCHWCVEGLSQFIINRVIVACEMTSDFYTVAQNKPDSTNLEIVSCCEKYFKIFLYTILEPYVMKVLEISFVILGLQLCLNYIFSEISQCIKYTRMTRSIVKYDLNKVNLSCDMGK